MAGLDRNAPGRAGARAPFWIALVPLLLLIWRFDFLVDDAFITFRYGANLAAGRGLVFNPGEEPPVEGYTNFLWLLVLALVQRLGLDPALWSRLLGAASAVALLWLLVRALPAGSLAARSGAALCFASLPPVAVWATGGLETMPFALAVFAVFERLTSDLDPDQARARARQAGLAGACAVLLRADGFVWLGLALLAALIRRPERRAQVARAALAAAAVLAAHALWRRGFYGEWGPNTARAKVHLSLLSCERGGQYVLGLLLAVLSVPLALALGAFGLRGPAGRLAAAALVFCAGGGAYLTLVGGDWMMMFRQLVPAMPFVALALAAGLVRLRTDGARAVLGASAVALSLLPAFDRHPAPRALRSVAHFRWGHEELSEYQMWRKGVIDIEEWIMLGKALAPHVKPGESCVLGNIGAIPFYSGLVAYDTHGLTNREPFAPLPDPGSPEARQMPGHDRRVDLATFDRYRPTFRGLQLACADDPRAGLPAHWFDPGSPMYGKVELEVVPLPPGQGFPADRVLQLVRNRW